MENKHLVFLPLLTLIFITLKLTNYIDWSWWWVLSPMLIPISIAVACWAIAGLLGLIITIIEARRIKKWWRKFNDR